jgi:hypothetical protein
MGVSYSQTCHQPGPDYISNRWIDTISGFQQRTAAVVVCKFPAICSTTADKKLTGSTWQNTSDAMSTRKAKEKMKIVFIQVIMVRWFM